MTMEITNQFVKCNEFDKETSSYNKNYDNLILISKIYETPLNESLKHENKTKTIYFSYNYNNNIIQNPIVEFIEHYRNVFSTPDNFIKRRVDYGKMKVSDEKYRKEIERRNSFVNFPEEIINLVKPIARSGFYYFGTEECPDKVKCIFCQGIIYDWKKSDIPVKEHKRSFPTCPFLLNLNVANQPLKEEVENISIQDPDLKTFIGDIPYDVVEYNAEFLFSDYIEFGIDWRENTFSNFDDLKYLSLDGLFIHKKDNLKFLKCHKCYKEVELLSRVADLPRMLFHNKNCDYFKIIETEISLTKKNLKNKNNANFSVNKIEKKFKRCQIEYSITNDEIEARLDSRITNEVEKLMHNRNKVKSIISSKLKTTGQDYESMFDLLLDLKNYTENIECCETSNSLEFILPDYVCVVCLDKPIEVVFLPCGHLKTCKTCSALLSSCPVCRKRIDKRVWEIQIL